MTDSDSNSSGEDAVKREFLAKAETVLARYAQTYREEIPQLLEKMDGLALQIEKSTSEQNFSLLMRMAHDMKGQAGMFGLPDFATVADSLSLLMAKGDKTHPHYFAAIRFHIETLRRLPVEPETVGDAEALRLILEAEREAELVLKSD